jgi:predicted DNA-binding transcriptional regulator YafY
MRADRLISILMLLQSRGRMTAQALADEFDVSERTIYRDIDALSISGVPIFPEHGPGGGFALLDSYRTTLTGMTEEELNALFLLSVPSPFEKLGISRELRSALLKLSASLPAARRPSEEMSQNRFLIDWEGFQIEPAAPGLQTIQQAVWKNRRLLLSYRLIMGVALQDVPVDPYALVAKAGAWYLVAMHEVRLNVYGIADLTGVRETGETFVRQAGFDLPTYWQQWCQRSEQRRRSYPVTVRFSPDAIALLPLYFGQRARAWHDLGQSAEDGWVTLIVEFESLEAARGHLLGMGSAVEVLAPLALRCSLADFAKQVARMYEPDV